MIDFIDESEKKKKGNKTKKTKKMLIGNKNDKGNIAVSKGEIDELCKKYKMKYLATSALENSNVSRAFEDLSREIYKEPDLWKFEDLKNEATVLAGKYANKELKKDNEG